ncbi:MAG: hypothetical protein A2046_00075 [Bacteroidetes bacterium GWA2_30_7]|nr:MAG: hypothetical protein A2046_00075 [Bacteroidetes bacterium GWA2_30_7]
MFAQTYKTVTIVEQTTKSLNGGTRSYLGGVSRIPIRVDLPANTVSWYYSFSTSPAGGGTQMLNLAVQIGASIYAGPLGAAATKNLKVPSGSGSLDVWVIPTDCRDNFVAKNDDKLSWYQDISCINTKQSVQLVSAPLSGSYYLGLRNPSSLEGIDVTIEVVAVVEEVNTETDKGMLYGNLGWKSFEKGEYDKCLEWSNKALTFNPVLTFVKFNIALVYLVQEKDESIDAYINALAAVKKDKNPKGVLTGALQDIYDLKAKKPNLKNLSDIEELVSNELNNY